MREIAQHRGDWAGIPMPIEGQQLVIEPSYPMGAELAKIGVKEDPAKDDALAGVKLRNCWWSDRLQAEVYIWQEADGRIMGQAVPRRRARLDLEIGVLGVQQVWGIEQEANAVHLLGTLLSHHQFKQYLLTGMFLERSTRSQLTYLFRKLRPTIAIDARDTSKTVGGTRILCALCLHPIAYYQETWAGAMCPTDDVISHLMLMRGDEVMFWRRSNQHPADRPEAGL